ncbi:hypothetical protein UK82_28390 [Frankia sp. ACN1ag]|nr:hypothetical protein UK82_28390 [Frankia sp. ACN1ag]
MESWRFGGPPSGVWMAVGLMCRDVSGGVGEGAGGVGAGVEGWGGGAAVGGVGVGGAVGGSGEGDVVVVDRVMVGGAEQEQVVGVVGPPRTPACRPPRAVREPVTISV